MTSPTSGISGNSPTSAAAQAATAAADKSKDLGDKDTFLKLLVAQLKYQDPSNPADSTQFLAQTAQFTQVERLGDIASMMKSQRMIGASSLVGKSVQYMDANGAQLSGVISAAKLNGDSEPMLRIGNTDVLLSKVMEVQTTPTTGSTTTAPISGTTPVVPSGPAATEEKNGTATDPSTPESHS
jgi:flagellar basal-body rod modification protein FlgD